MGTFPRYFADNGGSFEIAPRPSVGPRREANTQVLKQVVTEPPGSNAWTSNKPPITVVGALDWGEVAATVSVLLPSATVSHGGGNRSAAAAAATTSAGVCQRTIAGGRNGGPPLCLMLFGNGTWALGDRTTQSQLRTGALPGKAPASGAWHVLRLATGPGVATASIDGVEVATAVPVPANATGRLALISGYHEAFFDDFSVASAAEAP